MGAPTACETAGVPNVSYNGSTVKACPNTFIVSSRINWSKYYAFVVNSVKEGKEIPADWTGGFAEGSVELSDINETAAAPGTKDKVNAVIADLKAGKIKVFATDTFTVNGAKLDSYKADVDTDKDYTPDTEVIADGYFHESEKRSAPAFDLRIDGIELLNEKY
jgi:basic membrane protein A